MDAFFTIHDGLPREGPGDRESLDWALAQVALRPDAVILDAGCGPGADIAGLLDHAPEGYVLACDTHGPFAAAARARHMGNKRVEVLAADMLAPEGPFDLVWCAGAIYFAGVTEALAAWRPRLRPGGAVAFSQFAWHGAARPEAAQALFGEVPGLTDEAGLRRQVEAAGYRVAALRPLPDAAWEAYYGPLEERLAAMRSQAPEAAEPDAQGQDPSAADLPPPDPELAAALEAEASEIALWRSGAGGFGYLQVVAVPA